MPEDRSNPQHGAELRRGEWTLPPTITDAMVSECRAWLRDNEARSGMVQGGVLAQWLGTIHGSCAKRAADGEDVASWLKAVGFALEDHPAYCFTKTTMREAIRRFKFLPTGAELMAFADEIVTDHTTAAQRAWKVMDAGPRAASAMPWGPDAAEAQAARNRAKADQERAELAAIARQHATPTPARNPGEDDKAYGCRLAEHARAMCAAGGAALRGDEQRNMQRKAAQAADKLESSRKAAAEALARRSAATAQPEPAEPAEPDCIVRNTEQVSA